VQGEKDRLAVSPNIGSCSLRAISCVDRSTWKRRDTSRANLCVKCGERVVKLEVRRGSVFDAASASALVEVGSRRRTPAFHVKMLAGVMHWFHVKPRATWNAVF
jgi:hypothetical protein